MRSRSADKYLALIVLTVVAATALATTVLRRGRPGAAGDSPLPWRILGAGDVRIPLSSLKCTKQKPLYQICSFRNVMLHGGHLMYIVRDKKSAARLRLPDPTLTEVGNSPLRNFTAPERFHVLAQSDVAARLEAAARVSPGGTLLLAEFEEGILQRTRSHTNWFWTLNGAGNIYHRLCKYYGACSEERIKAAAILEPSLNTATAMNSKPPGARFPAIMDLNACFGPIFFVDCPGNPIQRQQSEGSDRVVLLGRVLAGIGDEVVEPESAIGPDNQYLDRYRRANASMSLRRARFMRRCAKLPAAPPPQPRPAVLLVNRPYADGRHIIGLDDVYDRVRRALPPDVGVQTYMPRVESMAAQAAVFAASNVVVVPHGSANANFQFLPLDAVVLALFVDETRHGLDVAHAAGLPAPPYNVTVLPVDCSESIEPSTSSFAALPAFQSMPREKRALVLLHSGTHAEQRKLWAQTGLRPHELMDHASYRPDPAALADQVLRAVGIWESKSAARAQHALPAGS